MTLNEQYLAGCILREDGVIWGLEGLVTAEDFQNEHCRAIFIAAKAIKDEGGMVDPAAIVDRARKNGVDLPLKFVAELMQIVPTTYNFSDYAKRVAEEARTRRVKELAAQIQNDSTSTSAELVNLLETETKRLKDNSQSSDAFLELFHPLSNFTEEEATWLIPGWIPEAQITLIAADGGVGKTTLWVDIIAALSAGRRCILDPEGHTRQPMKIAFCTTEDSVKKKLRKKLREAGANMDNIITMDLSADKTGALRNFKFGSSSMERFIKHFKPVACAFGPVQGFLPPKVNMGSRNEMRDCMAPLIALGEDTGTTFLIICHTNKRKGAYGRDRIADSADLWDIARSVIMAGYTETQGIRYLSNEKNNYTQLQETILFSIDESGQIRREGSSWKRDKEYMIEAATAKTAPKRDDCKEFILNALKDGPMKSDDLIKKAQEFGYSFITVKRIRKEMKDEGLIETYATGSAKKGSRVWYIRLKQGDTDDFEQLPMDEPVPFEPSDI